MEWVVVIAAGVLLMASIARSNAILRYTLSATAAAKGIDNTPVDPNVIARLQWMMTQEPAILAVLKDVEPLAHVSSAYRCPALNAAVGGVPTSRHQAGLALDFGGLVDEVSAFGYVASRRERLPSSLRLVYLESDHIHVEFFDPLRLLDSSTYPTRFASEV